MSELAENQESLLVEDSESSDSESQDEQEERRIDVQTLIKEFSLDGITADETWLKREKPSQEGMKDYELWRAKWAFQRCSRLGIHYRLPNDPEGVDFSSRFHARYFSLPVNKELWATLCEQEIQSARRQRREPDDIRTQKVLANEDARTFLVDQHIATLWTEGKELPPRAELTTPESIKRLQTAIRARRFRAKNSQ